MVFVETESFHTLLKALRAILTSKIIRKRLATLFRHVAPLRRPVKPPPRQHQFCPFKHTLCEVWSHQCHPEVSDYTMRKQEGHSLSAFPEIFTAREGSRHSHWIRPTSIFWLKWPHKALECFWRRELVAFKEIIHFQLSNGYNFRVCKLHSKGWQADSLTSLAFPIAESTTKAVSCNSVSRKLFKNVWLVLFVHSVLFVFFHCFLPSFALARSSTPRDVVRGPVKRRCTFSLKPLLLSVLSRHALPTYKKGKGRGLRMGKQSEGGRKAMEKQEFNELEMIVKTILFRTLWRSRNSWNCSRSILGTPKSMRWQKKLKEMRLTRVWREDFLKSFFGRGVHLMFSFIFFWHWSRA